MNRSGARKILRSRRGEMAALARKFAVTQQSVADVIDGKKQSERILTAAIERATELAAEKERAAAELEERACA